MSDNNTDDKANSDKKFMIVMIALNVLGLLGASGLLVSSIKTQGTIVTWSNGLLVAYILIVILSNIFAIIYSIKNEQSNATGISLIPCGLLFGFCIIGGFIYGGR
jgi:hypothetical protein